MATYVITEDPAVDWDEVYNYKYRYSSRDGFPLAQDELERRLVAGQPAVLWRWDHGHSKLIERHNV